jgi:glutamate-1-semialdehyde 2,1-aminomutase
MSAVVDTARPPLLRRYEQKTAGSRAIFERARPLLPDGVTHVGRFLEPHPIYVTRAAASRKWDVDGNEYVDYFGGHGALLLGHCHPVVMRAVEEQVARGAHYGASHELEVAWAEQIRAMVPSAEKLRFTVTGTEATLLALRVARAFTRKPKVVRFAGHFHGWHDHVAFPAGGAPGIVEGIVGDTIIVPPNDLDAVEAALRAGNVAVVMLEPTGATFGQIPTSGDVLRQLRQLTRRYDSLLLFDEVIAGFRCSPGGAQAYYGVTPDLTTLAKIIAGGYPGAALVGKAEVMSVLEYRRENGRIVAPAVPHQGTYNAGPVSAAAGLATLQLIQSTDAIARANAAAKAIRDGMNEVLRRRRLGWCVYGEFSDFHLYLGGDVTPGAPEEIYAGGIPWTRLKGATPTETIHQVRLGMLCEGVDIVGWPGGVVSAVHSPDDVQRTVAAFDATLEQLM